MVSYNSPNSKTKYRKEQSADGWYAEKKMLRQIHLGWAYEISQVSDPTLYPLLYERVKEQTGYYKIRAPFQSFGMRLLDNYASLMLMSTMPLQQSYVKFVLNPLVADRLRQINPQLEAKFNERLMVLERQYQQEVDVLGLRSTWHEALTHSAIGNSLYYFDWIEGKHRNYRLDEYVIDRDGVGTIQGICTRARVDYRNLPEETQKALYDTHKVQEDDEVDLYERVCIKSGSGDNLMYESYQEAEGVRIESTEGTWKKDELPWVPLRGRVRSGDSYGTGFMHIVRGNLRSVEGLAQLLLQGGAALAKVIFLVDESMGVYVKNIVDSPNCAVLPGRANAVSVVQSQKSVDLKFASEVMDKFIQDMYQAGMMFMPRDSERTPLGETEIMDRELQTGRAGFFTLIYEEGAKKVTNLMIAYLRHRKMFPNLDPLLGQVPALKGKFIVPRVLAGIDAIGRNQEAKRYLAFQQLFNQSWGGPTAPAWAHMFDPRSNVAGIAALAGIDPALYGIKTTEQISQDAQQQQQQQTAQIVGQQMTQSLGKIAEQRAALPATAGASNAR